jgi:hypothetical protein
MTIELRWACPPHTFTGQPELQWREFEDDWEDEIEITPWTTVPRVVVEPKPKTDIEKLKEERDQWAARADLRLMRAEAAEAQLAEARAALEYARAGFGVLAGNDPDCFKYMDRIDQALQEKETKE